MVVGEVTADVDVDAEIDAEEQIVGVTETGGL